MNFRSDPDTFFRVTSDRTPIQYLEVYNYVWMGLYGVLSSSLIRQEEDCWLAGCGDSGAVVIAYVE
jgi:hypothetical protein